MMPAMEGLIKLFNTWEIQLLVLLSFTLQIFLFFTGSLRQHSTSMFLRISIWGAYLGADFVAVYTLGRVSRHEDITIERFLPGKSQPLAFFWAPFLLIHLGGQDTITAFAMEDNNLWLRHLLNLVVQVILAIYVFWKSIGRHSVELLVSGVFVFVVGVIKYGERIWSLKCGCFESFESSSGHHYKKFLGLATDSKEDMDEESNIKMSTRDGYDSIVYIALHSMPRVHDIFSGRGLFSKRIVVSSSRLLLDVNKKAIKMVHIILSVMYVDLYTKALLIRTRCGIILRCISQMSVVVAFAVFHANDKQRYSKVDIAITYSLFVGGFFLEVCAMFISMISPWTWAWLKVRNWDKLAKLSWFIFSSDKRLWTKSMGQYNFVSWVTGSGQARTFKQRVMMTMVKWFANLVRAERKKIFWISKLLDTEYVDVGDTTMECVAEEIRHLRDEGYIQVSKEWANFFGNYADFGGAILLLHVLTVEHLSKHPTSGEVGMMEVCRKLSNYMMYLLATKPSMLPLNVSAGAVLDELQDVTEDIESLTKATETDFKLTREVLEVDLVHVWARLLIYAAGKSRGGMHMAQLSRGGELITFVWLLMALHGLGDSDRMWVRLTNAAQPSDYIVQEIYAFPVPATTGPEEASIRPVEIDG
ncbi:hypothetical protein ACQJBY_014551 [Aegilops geniculata]